jgi:N-acetyl-anhydromuramyl-L-alanine amidase AmpD
LTDYPGAIWLPNNNFFADTGRKRFLILHGTAGGTSAQEIAHYFKGTEQTMNPVASNYIVDQAGVIVQTVLEKDGAFAQGVVNSPNWLGNPNIYCLSIEYVKSSTDNADALTPAQQAASFALIKDICQRNGIGMHDADDATGITGHFAIDPINRSRCPGAFDWNALWTYLKGESMSRPTQYQQAAADASWKSVFLTIGTPPPVTGTGIYQVWLSDFINGKFHGPPLTHEYSTVDWSGNVIIAQEFAHARAEWRNGLLGWYGSNG